MSSLYGAAGAAPITIDAVVVVAFLTDSQQAIAAGRCATARLGVGACKAAFHQAA
jgi:hypothetical protein